MAVYKLEIEYDFDFELFAIRSSEEFYRLAFLINRHLQIGLKKSREVAMVEEVEGMLKCPYYYWTDPLYESEWFVVKNKGVRQAKSENIMEIGLFSDLKETTQIQSNISKEYKHIDYFVQVYGIMSRDLKSRLLNAHKEINEIQTILELDVPNMKDKENFLLINYAD